MIQLERNVEVRIFEAEATVAVGRERPEFLAVARLAADLQKPLDGAIVARELLGGLPPQTGWRVIDRCLALGLLERESRQGPIHLSESGRRALEQGAVLVPEEGVWRFYLIEDPLIDVPLVHVARLESRNAKEERDDIYKAKKEGARAPQGVSPPGPLARREFHGRFLTSVVAGRGFEVREVAPRGELGPPSSLRLILQWRPEGAPQLALRGHLPGARERTHERVDHQMIAPSACGSTSYDALWRALVSSARRVPVDELERWQSATRRRYLPVPFDASLTEPSRRTHSLDLEVPATNLGALGRFDATRLSGIELVPRSEQDAQAWAEWLQWDGLARYVTPPALTEQAQQIARRFPYHRPRLPDAAALLSRAIGSPLEPRSRFLLAPSDLGLWS